MTALAWFLEAAFPVSLGAGLALAFDIARHPPVPHYRIRNWFFLRRVHAIESRSRTPGGSATTPDRHDPQVSSGPRAGGGGAPDRGSDTPPAPTLLAGAADPRSVALARLQHGASR